MALDGIFISSIVKELKDKLLNSKVDKINQPESDEVLLTLRGERSTFKLLVSSSASYPKLHLTDIIKPNPLKAPMFCMVLRKHILNARIINITQLTTDRIIKFDFKGLDELGYESVYSLIIEIMGRHSNITLLRDRDNIVMDSIKHITPDISQYRSLFPGIKYTASPPTEKLNPYAFTKDEYVNYIKEKELSFEMNFFSKVFTGVSKQLSKELYLRLNPIDDSSFKLIQDTFYSMKDGNFEYFLYSEPKGVKDFYCLNMESLKEYTSTEYTSPSKLLEDFYYQKDRSDRLNSKSADLQRMINTNIERCLKKIDIWDNTLRDCVTKDKLKLYGELLTANIYSFKKGDKDIKVLNYYSEEEEYINIPLDANKTPSEIIQNYYRRYNKMKKSEEMAISQKKVTVEELDYLQSVFTNIKNCEGYDEIEEIRKELMASGYIKFKKSEKRKPVTPKPSHYLSKDGIDIFVGKNNIQNDYLTLKFADKHDLWLHTKNIPGSHVIIKKFGDIPEDTLLEAANLAAYYSKGKDGVKIAVDYTEVRNVRKPSGAKPGMVIYYTNKTIYVDPAAPLLKKI